MPKFKVAEVMFQAGYIEKYGTGITENIRKMQEAHLLAPDIDLSAEFVTTIRRNDATSSANVATNDATSPANDATSKDYLARNKAIIDSMVKPKIKPRMKPEQIRELILEACVVEHSIEELAELLHKSVTHIRNRFITDLVTDGVLLPTKPRHSPGQSYFTNPKHKETK